MINENKPETLQDVIDCLYKQLSCQEFGHIIRVPIDLIDRLEAIQERMDENRWNECYNGIHFYITRQEVVDY